MKRVIVLFIITAAVLVTVSIHSQKKSLQNAKPVVLSEAQQRLADDIKYFRTSARNPNEHYQEHLRDIVHCQQFVAWLGENPKIFEALNEFFNSGRRNGIDFFYNKPSSNHQFIQNIMNSQSRVDVYSDFHDGTSDAHFEQMHCNTKKEARLVLLDEFGLSYQAWQIRKSIFEKDCKDVADASDNHYGSATIETLKMQLGLIRQRYSTVFADEIRQSIDQCQKSIRSLWIDTDKQYDNSKVMRANAQSWIDELDRDRP